ncbi:hypothetical protein Achl_4051 (plasmid) [Pseudarthrobacter chlorophenolicus A6]|uniref:Uncharacterized protein n=1 Tax=Pseudarthrobacter chlorophenolicus (strain ATCC 700700 / DSM 12829 / CIP 107037 / JCM 12360 / KCTC 9906 / NCIMB 13794 / A6) TaxID=452863 RepID=B8HHV5_PSECP|nr:hypothetical protein [Pseudarthrobacter chlorophenolicus]ACL42002.1 hypothetical protein Achl_4051 [Pseudarthrobacter chlorophenolicus A6]SDQ20147.1 hypothetical protein SAMN04489738_0702 [Pseudarthrobacter chlorophenolicus]
MGHWETEHGEIILPSAEFAAARQAAQKAEHEHQSRVFDETQSFWKGLTRKEQTDPAAYEAARRKMIDARRHAIDSARRSWGSRSITPHAEQLVDDLDTRLTLYRGQPPARVLKSDIPFPTNRTTEFPAGEGSITFDKDSNKVSFDTGQYRDVIAKARNSPAGTALFAKLQTVKWTRGTGGIFHGDNELNDEETDRGQYVTTAYGPIGAAQEPSHCQEYTDSKGNRVTRAELSKLQQELWDAQRKIQNRMTKATAAAGRGKTTAASNRGSFASYQHAEPTFRL